MNIFSKLDVSPSPHRFVHNEVVNTVTQLQKYVDQLPKEWDRSKFVLCGSAAMAVRGIRDVHDLDVLVLPELMPAVKEAFPETKRRDEDPGLYPNEGDCAIIVNGIEHVEGTPREIPQGMPRVELWRAEGFDFFDALLRPVATNRQVFQEAGEWNGYLVMSLRHCLAVKALGYREKDKADIVKSLMTDIDDESKTWLATQFLPYASAAQLRELSVMLNEMNA